VHHEEIELNFEASCQLILGLESEILWEARRTPTLTCFLNADEHQFRAQKDKYNGIS
jgi:hypothetical protein